MAILHIFNKERRKSELLGEIIKIIKAGDKDAREKLIKDYTPFIIKVIAKTTGKHVELENSEEFSIGLLAFNEAIDSFDSDKYSGFLSFSETVIKRRVIDYIRKDYKNNQVYPLTYFQNDNSDVSNAFEEKHFKIDASSQFENIETKEELSIFINRLAAFDIKLTDLVNNAPKHLDSKQLAIKTARILAENKELSEKLEKKKTIPMVDLMQLVNVNHKTIERNRKFIISVYVILTSKLEVIQGYVENVEKGGK